MRRPLAIAAGLLLCLAKLAQPQEPARIPVDTFSLANGLRVILSEDHSSQVVTVDLWYDVGSRNEVRGRTGFAHLFEHLMFQGSAHVKKGEHFQLVERAGGELNGTTAEDRTAYYEMLPSNRLNLGLWLEADRMRSLAVTDSTFENQRQAVKEERRLRVDNQPYSAAIFEGMYLLQDSTECFPYAHSVIGSMADLDSAKTGDVKAFFDLYYAPNNATLVVAGDFTPAEAKALIQQYFGDIPRGKDPPPVTCEAWRRGRQIRRPWPDDKATLPAVLYAYRAPEYRHADYPALELLANILGQGESSRINQSVVRERRLAQTAFVLMNPAAPRRGPGVLLALAIANQGISPDSIEEALGGEAARVAREGVSEAELTKAKNSYRADVISRRQISFYMAEAIQNAALFGGDPGGVNSDLARHVAVTAEDIKRVAAQYLTPDNALVLLITPRSTR